MIFVFSRIPPSELLSLASPFPPHVSLGDSAGLCDDQCFQLSGSKGSVGVTRARGWWYLMSSAGSTLFSVTLGGRTCRCHTMFLSLCRLSSSLSSVLLSVSPSAHYLS